MISGKICITGGTGFIGINLIKSLLDIEGLSILAIARSKKACKRFIELNVGYYLDDGDTEHLISFFQEHKFDTVIHLASLYLKHHQSHQTVDLISSNVLFGTRLLEASVNSSVKSFINTGSFWQHYESKNYSPVNLYAATKQAFEAVAQYYVESSDILFTTLYLNDTYGPGDTRKKILNIWNSMKITDSLVMSPGEQKVNLLHIRDVVSGYLKLIDFVQYEDFSKEIASSYILKSKEDISLIQLARLYEKLAKKKLNIQWGGTQYKSREVMTVWDGGTIVPDWEPKMTLEDGLKELIFKSHELH